MLRGSSADIPAFRQVNFDFPLVQVLLFYMALGMNMIFVSYDIACQYYVNFYARISHQAFPLMNELYLKRLREINLKWLVPKFHLGAHIPSCADNFAYNFTKWVGRTAGELVEVCWSSFDALASSIREMGFGHRRDTVNDNMAHWNWRKNTEAGT